MKTVQDAIHVLQGTDWDARFQAEKFLAETASASELLSHLDDPDWKVRLHVARAIAQLPESAPELIGSLEQCIAVEEDDWVRRNLEWAVRQHR